MDYPNKTRNANSIEGYKVSTVTVSSMVSLVCCKSSDTPWTYYQASLAIEFPQFDGGIYITRLGEKIRRLRAMKQKKRKSLRVTCSDQPPGPESDGYHNIVLYNKFKS